MLNVLPHREHAQGWTLCLFLRWMINVSLRDVMYPQWVHVCFISLWFLFMCNNSPELSPNCFSQIEHWFFLRCLGAWDDSDFVYWFFFRCLGALGDSDIVHRFFLWWWGDSAMKEKENEENEGWLGYDKVRKLSRSYADVNHT